MNSTNHSDRQQALQDILRQRILVGDGAMGTMIQAADLTAEDFGGPSLEGCNEVLVDTRPDVIRNIHRAFLEAGADFVETNSFGSTPLVLAEYGLAERALELNRKAASLAREVADDCIRPGRPRFVVGSMGPTTKAISVTGGVTFQELIEHFAVQAQGLIEGGVDWLLLETSQDTRNIKAGVLGIEKARQITGVHLPLMISGTIELSGTMLAGQTAEALCVALMHLDLLALGLNCATGPQQMTDHLRDIAQLMPTRISCMPNAGLPDEEGAYPETPASLARAMERFMAEGWLNIVGGCCGTTPDHIRALAEVAQKYKPHVPVQHRRTLFSGVEVVEADDQTRPLLVGERTNVIGSRKFRRLIAEEQYEIAAEIGRSQVQAGAHIIDVCVQDPDRDETHDMSRFLERLIQKIRVPLMIDTTDADVIELALTYCQGKSIINSINLEDGEERFMKVVPLAKRYGAALVVGTIDEDPQSGMGVTRDRKLAIATRSYELLVNKYDFPPQDIIWDPLVFPCATGDQNYIGSAKETIEGIRLIKERFPETRTILGVSNVSFGLPPAGREVLNSVFLYHCVQAGLDLAIVNTEKLERYPSIPEEERLLAENLLFNLGDDPIAAFAAHFRDQSQRPKTTSKAELPLDERLARYIIEGSKLGLAEDLELKLKEAKPLEIINGPLMAGMSEVGRLFNDNKLIVAEVLQSAEAMKAAVSFIEPYMEKSESSHRGSILLATVKGDVHDIGKNLVDIILSNNGYRVINLGIKIPPDQIIQAVRTHQPDAIGLSGLLVKSAQQMVSTAADLRAVGIELPLLVGGAALSRRFSNAKIAAEYDGLVVYAEDAMDGLDLLNQVMSPELRTNLENKIRTQQADAPQTALRETTPSTSQTRSSTVATDLTIQRPPDLERHVLRIPDLEAVWDLINPQMLYVRHLGLRGRFDQLLESGDPKAIELKTHVDRVKAFCLSQKMEARAVWQFFPAEGSGNQILVFEPNAVGDAKPIAVFDFPRQPKPDGLCLSDLLLPPTDGQRDHLALFVGTFGTGIRRIAEDWKEAGRYLDSHILQALALESAEATAEWIHRKLRADWGFPDPPDLDHRALFRAEYRGKRYSFGYPACPDLEPQEILFQLIKPDEIQVELTDGFMMDPEGSVSAMVFHHPDAKYFSV